MSERILQPSILCISGTNRPENYTSYAASLVVAALHEFGAEARLLDGRSLELGFPGYPETADAESLREAVRNADGVVMATPEYHGSYSAMTKLIIENLGFPSALSGKPVALVGVAAGRIGAVKSLEQLRSVCAHTGAIVMPGAVSIAGVRKSFDESGRCIDPPTEKALRGVARSLLNFLREYVCAAQVLERIARDDGPPWCAAV